jgi:hypothetical protein
VQRGIVNRPEVVVSLSWSAPEDLARDRCKKFYRPTPSKRLFVRAKGRSYLNAVANYYNRVVVNAGETADLIGYPKSL